MGCIFSRLFKKNIKVYGECIICLEEITSSSKVIALRCAHVYHEHCVNAWMKKKSLCPICYTKV